ncbi:MAG: prolipoprotein diacylglyceryl transferase [Thermoanaerobaculia bacterium]|nr:prolipoprotein diacylglyceryl transferase [Thermoanaerobaculia bacterium]MCZ7650680.1 prolipoprotein diacylglyceryl transferase [Thermoanaerobaculia bacterium]
MIQELFRIGPIAISPFGVMMVLAFLAGYAELRRNLLATGAGDDDDASSLVFAAGLAGIAGAKVYYAALYRDFGLLFERSGLVWYGGFLAGVAAVLWVAHRRRIPYARLVDAMAPALALGYGIGRIGCFLVGDDYGRPTDLPWGITYPNGLPPTTAGFLRSEFGVDLPASVPDSALLAVHPTQLYELALGVAIWLVGRRLLGRLAAGEAGLWVLSLLSAERFLIEFLRAKDDRFLGAFTVAQAVALAVLAVCLLLIARVRHRAASSA